MNTWEVTTDVSWQFSRSARLERVAITRVRYMKEETTGKNIEVEKPELEKRYQEIEKNAATKKKQRKQKIKMQKRKQKK